jgi:hypothetical protein
MEAASGRDPQVRVGFAPEELTVLNWPLWQEGWRAWTLLVAAAGLVFLVAWQTESVWVASFAGIALAGVLWRLWLPVRFEFRRHGIVQVVLGRRTRIPWSSIASYRPLPGGALLMPDLDQRPFAPLRGLFIAWAGKRAEIIANLDFYLSPTPPNNSSVVAAGPGNSHPTASGAP